MLLQSLRALYFAPGGPESIWNYLGAPARSTRVSGRFACGCRTDLHCADAETPRWRISPRPVSVPHVAWRIALRLQFCCFFSLCQSPILNKYSGVVANCDHTSGWVHWVYACIRIAMQQVTLQKSLLAFLLHYARGA